MNFIYSKKFYVISVVSLFFLSALLGFLLLNTIDYLSPNQSEEYIQLSPGFETSFKIFMRNIIVALILVSGLFLFGIPTLIVLIVNGFWLGSTIALLLLDGDNIANILSNIIPHGILEIPGLLIAGYIGLNGMQFYFRPKVVLNEAIKLLLVSIILLAFGSLIEGLYTIK
ncbi:MAG: stage II sporulation protein M [Carnobacterium alterfunditum]